MTIPSLRSLAIWMAVLALPAAPAWPARVVEVRVGSHPKFTRVVFELDAPAGYRIERKEAGPANELVVTLDAASERRVVTSRGPMVAGVEVDASGDDSIARVRLRRSAPRVKEMILGGPPRIVLDFVLPDDLASAAPKPKASTPAPKPLVVADAPEAERPESSPPSPAPAPKPIAQSKPTPSIPEAKPIAESKPTPSIPVIPESRPVLEPEPELAKAPSAEGVTPTPTARVESALEGERIVEPKPARPEPDEEVQAGGPSPAPVAPPPVALEPVAKPPVAAPPKPIAKAPAPTTPSSWISRFAWRGADPRLVMGLVGGGALLLLIAAALLLRRRSGSTSLDALEIARDQDEAMGAGDGFETSIGADSYGEARPSRDGHSVMGTGLFDEETDKGDSAMGMEAVHAVERESRGRMASTAGLDSDLGSTLREIELRVAQLEGRLEQANEARERLERQVTAQSEELRVQRAAIARTQRALRGMSRGGEDQATEPALRDPAKPTPGR